MSRGGKIALGIAAAVILAGVGLWAARGALAVAAMERIASVFETQARAMPSHADYIARLAGR